MKAIKQVLIFLLVTVLMSGCVSHVFNQPMAISSKSSVCRYVKEKNQEVSVHSVNCFFVLIPFISDPRKQWDRLLDETERKGGNAVVDLQSHYSSSSFFWMFPPIVWIDSELDGTVAQFPAK